MAGYYEKQETNNQIPILHHDLNADQPIVLPAIKPFEFTGLRAQVDEMIDRGFSDMWLLLDGEEIERDFMNGIWRDGRAFAMVMEDQVCLLSSKFSAINALLSVGVTML